MDYVTQDQWQELEARVARLEAERGQGTGNREQNAPAFVPPLLPVMHSPLREEKLRYSAPRFSGAEEKPEHVIEIETLWMDAPFAAKCAFLKPLLEDDSPEWVALLEQLEAMDAMREQRGSLEEWLMQYPALFADAVEKLTNIPEPLELEERVAAQLLSEFRLLLDSRCKRLGLNWIVPKSGATITAECEVVGTEASAALMGTVARCVRRGFQREGKLILAAQVTRSNGQGVNAPTAPVIETYSAEMPQGQTESFSPALGDAFDEETMEIVGARRTAHAHEDNTIARVETPGTRRSDTVVAKAQVLIYRMGAGQ